MKRVLVLFISSLLPCGLYADSTVCSAGPTLDTLTPVACSSLTGIDGLAAAPFSAAVELQGNTVSGQAGFINLTGFGPFTQNEQVVFSFKDTIAIPDSPAGDVFKITAQGGILTGGRFDQYGASAKGQILAGTYLYDTPYGDCEFGTCIDKTTIPAIGAPYLTLQGDGSILVGPQLNTTEGEEVAVAFNEQITMERFKADGVTPDNFTPEPASTGMSIAGFFVLGFALRRRKSQVAR